MTPTGRTRGSGRWSVPVAIVSALAALLLFAAPAGAADVEIIQEEQVKPRLVELTISTPAFTEPTKVHVILPVGYDADPARRWPTTYFLAGTMNTYRSFSASNGAELAKDFPSIIVSPNGDSGYWSDWYNGGANGPPMYETYVIDQLIPLIDRRFRTRAERSQRAVMGVSMGAYGAMMFAARHPDLFAAAASISGAVDSNLAPLGAALSVSPTFQGGSIDAIHGPRATQEIRWRGHNPTDLAGNLRGLDVQLRTANGVLNPGIGEDPLSADAVSCVVEKGVHDASVSMNAKLDALRIPHLWKDYGNGCHTRPNFARQNAETFLVFEDRFADPPPAPSPFEYRSIEPEFGVWGWHVSTDPERALQFLRMNTVSADGLTLVGSGTTTVTSPPVFGDASRVELENALPKRAVPDAAGRIRFTVDLGPPDTGQQYTPGAVVSEVRRTVTFTPVPKPGRGPGDGPGPGTVPSAKRCVVPKVTGRTLRQARKRLRRAHCRLGKVKGKRRASARVVAQHPKPRKRVRRGTKVRVTLKIER